MTNATNIMKHCVAIVLLLTIIISASADEAKSSGKAQQHNIISSSNNGLLSSSSATNELKQPNKRLAYYAPPGTLSSGFKPITASYPTVSNFVSSHHHQQQPYASAVSNSYAKYPTYTQQQQQQTQFVSPSSVKYSVSSAPSAYNRAAALSYGYSNGNNYHSYPQQLAFAASQPAAVSYVQSPFHLAQQIFAHHLPLTNYNVHQVAPLIHSPNIGLLGAYHHHHAPVNAYQQQQQQQQQYSINNKIPQYPSYYNQPQPPKQQQHQQHQQQQQQNAHNVITSKPVALERPLETSSPVSSSAANEVHHNQHGAVSYSAFKLPSASALIATPPPQHVIYSPPQTLLDYGKHYSSAYPLHSVPFGGYSPAAAAPAQPYAHINRISVIPTPAVPTQVLSVSVVPTIPQKISLH